MIPKNKAKKIVDEFQFILTQKQFGKKCALICVDEIMQAMDDVMLPNPFKQYWLEVKKEILTIKSK